jgi:propanediol utilization protein
MKRLLFQPGQYLSDVRVKGFCPSKKRVKEVSLLIPFRKETQLEISNSDFLYDIKD